MLGRKKKFFVCRSATLEEAAKILGVSKKRQKKIKEMIDKAVKKT